MECLAIKIYRDFDFLNKNKTKIKDKILEI